LCTDVINPKKVTPDQLPPYYKKISVNDKVIINYFFITLFMVLK